MAPAWASGARRAACKRWRAPAQLPPESIRRDSWGLFAKRFGDSCAQDCDHFGGSLSDW